MIGQSGQGGMASEDKGTRTAIFASVLAPMLRPLIRVLIVFGITAPAFYRIVKQVYVEVAERDFRLEGKRPTDTRVNLLTGVHRKDIRAMRDETYAEARDAALNATVMATLIGRWLGDPTYRDPAGGPRPLPRAADEGPSFEALANAVSNDMRPRTLLDELEAQGIVTVDRAARMVTLHADALAGPADFDQRAAFFAENLADHLAAAGANLETEEGAPPFLERAVFYNRLSPASLDLLEAEARGLAGEALRTLNARAFALQEADAAAEEDEEARGIERRDAETAWPRTGRFRFGLYFYRAPDDDGDDDGEDPGSMGDDGVERSETDG
ncbi:MAG: DUF6502 family protein [Pseudomonadota bacterium]